MSVEMIIRASAIAALAGCASSAGAQLSPSFPTYSIQRIGLFGPAHTGTTGLQSSTASYFNAGGQVVGTSDRIFGAGSNNGRNTWVYNPVTNTTVQTGLTGYSHTGSAGYQESFNSFQNSALQVAGYSYRCTGVRTYNGRNTWFYDPSSNTTVQTGLTGAEYTGSEGYEESYNEFQPAGGLVFGVSTRISGSRTNNGQDSWCYNPATNTTVRTGLTGAANTGSTGWRANSNEFISPVGQVAGFSPRVVGESTINGLNTWVYNPATNTTVQTGLTGAGYTGSSGFESSANTYQNAAGQVVGYSRRITGEYTRNGQNTWAYLPASGTTVLTGLTGVDHTGSEGYQYSVTTMLNPGGQVAGYSERISGVSTTNGRNTWVYNPVLNTTVQTGLTGSVYTGSAGYQFGGNSFQYPSGYVSGYSTRVTGIDTENGQNTWFFSPATHATVQTGLTELAHTGSAGYQFSRNEFQNDAGQVAGSSDRVTGLRTNNGRNTWVYAPATNTTVQTGLTAAVNTGSGGFQYSVNTRQNAAGQVVGISRRISGVNTENGWNSWVYSPDTNITVQIGLTGVGYTGSSGYQYSSDSFQNAAGQVAGFSRRITGLNTVNGATTWVFNPAAGNTVQTGLNAAANTGSAGYQFSSNTYQNSAGQVVGYSDRVTGTSTNNGRDTWYYEPTSARTFAIIGSVRASDGYAYSTSTMLTEDGFALGNYLFFPGGLGSGEQRAFIFRPDLGMTDLGNLVAGGLTANGWSTLQNPIFASVMSSIVGYGLVDGQTTGQSVFVMTVPSPSAVGILALGAVFGARRRRS